MSVLLDYGAGPGIVMKEYGDTALMLASSSGHLDVVQLLTARGAWVNVRNNKGHTLFLVANYCKYVVVANYLRIM